MTTNQTPHKPIRIDKRGGRQLAYIGTAIGFIASASANIADVYVKNSTPSVGPIIGAVFWPTSLFLASEIMARKKWPEGYVWILVRMAGLLPIALVAALISYEHLHDLMLSWSETREAAALGPLSIDGLMMMSSLALLAPDRKPRIPKVAEKAVTEPKPHSAVDELILVGRAVLAELASEGRKPSKTGLAEGLRKRGHRIGDKRVAELFEQLAS